MSTTDHNRTQWNITDEFTNPDIRNNLFYKCDDFGSYKNIVSSSTLISDIITYSGEKPAPFFTLSDGSPAINAGVYTGKSDLEDYIGSAPDIGPYEKGGDDIVGVIGEVPTPETGAPGNPTNPSDGDYEAEAYTSESGTAIGSEHPGYSGSGFVDFGGNGTWIEWNNVNDGSGEATLTFRYANGSSGNRQCAITVNGASAGNVAFAPTGGWTNWNTVEKTVTLNGGNNTIKVTANTGSGGPNLDYMDVDVAASNIINVGDVIWLQAKVNGKYVSADLSINSLAPLYANKTDIGTWEQFTVEDAGEGFYALKAKANGKYVRARQNTGKIVNANSTSIGNWEKIQFEYTADGYVVLKFDVSGEYAAAEDYGNAQLIANRSAIGNWEKFSWGKISGNARKAVSPLKTKEEKAVQEFLLYPNPNTNVFFVEWQNEELAEIRLFDAVGKLVHYGIYYSGDKIQLQVPTGLYLLKAKIDEIFIERKLIVK